MKRAGAAGASFLDVIHPDNLKLIITSKAFKQRQGDDWRINNPSGYKDYDLFVCYGGSAEFTLGGKRFLVKEGHGFLATPNAPLYAVHKGPGTFDAIAQHFELRLFGAADFFSLINYHHMVRFSNWDYVGATLERFAALNMKREKTILQHSLFFSVLAEFIYDAFTAEKDSMIDHNYYFIIKMMSYIDSRLIDDNAVNNAFSLSPYGYDYTAALFKKHVGMTPKRYFLNMRLRQSKDLLMQGYSVREAAIHSGFKDELYFSRLFKKYERMSPSEYKQSILTAKESA
ncbi:MAG: helix-turn-helix transcriptional regulator [Spirochaetes bacterium]|nr:helix-turn-helix transcriptional regulator [Spirochaetota bacterium]